MQLRSITLLLCLMAVLCSAFPQTVSEAEARAIAGRFFSAHSSAVRSRSWSETQLTQVLPEGISTPYIYKGVNGEFVLVSKMNRENPIVGYGDAMGEEKLPAEVASLMGGLNTAKSKVFLESGASVKPVAPLLKTVRTQYAPFNERCPYYVNPEGEVTDVHCMVGCVATALEEVLTYYAYPCMLRDTLFGWTAETYKVDTILPGTKIDFKHILPEYREGHYDRVQADAVASLCYYCGIASFMDWGLNSSGTSIVFLEYTLPQAFGYGYVRHVYAGDYTPQHWRELIDAELAASRPVLFAGYTSLLQGHAFVIDGVNADGFYHIHWGYGGKYDGYFDLSLLNTFEQPQFPTETGKLMGHFCNQEALFLYPGRLKWEKGDTIVQRDNLRVDSVSFVRNPDCNGYVTAELYVRNISDEATAVTVELLTFALGEKAAFYNGDYVSLTGTTLNPREVKMVRAVCQFSVPGQRVFGISDNDSTFLYIDTLQIGARTEQGVAVTDVRPIAVDRTSATFEVALSNRSDHSYAGDKITYSIFLGNYTDDEGDWRQWKLLNLSPSETLKDTVTFSGLQPGEDYTFAVRNPWLPEKLVKVRTLDPTAVKPVSGAECRDGHESGIIYDLQGKPILPPSQKWNTPYINNRRIWIKRKP